jgi:recombination protein RecT
MSQHPQTGEHDARKGLVLARDADLKSMLEKRRAAIQDALPRHLTPERLIKVAQVAVSRVPLLQQCTALSLCQCVLQAAQLGLDCSGVLGSAYMVPFYNKKIGAYEAQFIPGYRGLVDLARRSGNIDDIYAQVVYDADEFDIQYGSEPKITHRPSYAAERSDDRIIGAYMVAWVKGAGRPHIEFMTRGELEAVRDSSKGAFDRDGKPTGPWRDWFGEMCRKTVVRRGVKMLPMSVELAAALEADNASNMGPVVDVSAGMTRPRLADRMPKQLESDAEGDSDGVPAEAEAPAAGKPVIADELITSHAAFSARFLELAKLAGLSAKAAATALSLSLGEYSSDGEKLPAAQRLKILQSISAGAFDWDTGQPDGQ